MENKLIEDYCNDNGILLYGITDASPFENIRETLIAKNESLKGFVEQDIEKRIDPALTLPNVKSIIVTGEPYRYRKPCRYSDSQPRGTISVSAAGEDYHISAKRKLQGLVNYLAALYQFDYKIFSDTGPLVERELAVRAGIGFYGRNNFVISKMGSMFHIAYALVSIEILPTKPAKNDGCTNCGICVSKCPGKALSDGFALEKCVSYLTQKKGDLSESESEQIGANLYGCDICQIVCPYNKQAIECSPDPEKNIELKYIKPKLTEILNMTNKQFKETYASTAVGWIGKKRLRRNAEAAYKNITGEPYSSNVNFSK